jgi:aldehyde dehydrogenase (NAD+)
MGYINAGIKEGATVAIGGEPSSVSEGYYIKPTIFTEARAGMKIVEEEIFGPVAVVIKFKNEEGLSHRSNAFVGFCSYRLSELRSIFLMKTP